MSRAGLDPGALDFLPSPGIDRRDVTAALLSALLLNLAGPPGPGVLVLIAPVPFLLRWARRRRMAGLRWSISYGALFFTLLWAIELLWVLRLLRVAAWPLPGYLGQVAALGLIGGLFGVALFAARRLPLFVGAPVAWLGTEVLRADLLGPLDFGWHPLALSLVDLPVLLQPAAWVGETGLGLGVVMVAGLITAGLYRGTRWWEAGSGGRDPGMSGSAWSRFAAAVALLLAWGYGGALRLNAIETRTLASMVVVQPNVPLEVRRDSARAVPEAIAAVESLLDAAVRAGPGEIVLPETALPLDLDSDSAQAIAERWVERTGRPIWVGGFTSGQDGGLHNAIVRFDRTGPAGRWEKVELVPGVEWGPGSVYRRGRRDQELLRAGGVDTGSVAVPVGALVCIEATHASLVRRHAAAGARFLLNATNDAWLSEGTAGSHTLAFHTHVAHLRLRSVETGLGAVRVANNGLSGTATPDGGWSEAMPPHIPGVRSVHVASLEESTTWVRWGWLLRWGTLLALAVLAVAGAVTGRGGR